MLKKKMLTADGPTALRLAPARWLVFTRAMVVLKPGASRAASKLVGKDQYSC